jgi:hypothetical protein
VLVRIEFQVVYGESVDFAFAYFTLTAYVNGPVAVI